MRNGRAQLRPDDSIAGPARAADDANEIRANALFAGFTPLDANFLYCPNQFLDICLPHHSRGCVRLVGFLFRKTLGWRDEFGRPLQQRIPVPYSVLIEEAGISRGAIRDAIDEAVKARLIRCTLEGRAHANGRAAQSASYELRWDHGTEFARSPAEFKGFFAGDGHRTPIPNDFFDVVVPCEPLAVIRVVGAVIRKTIGYQDQFGGRRMAAPLSFTELQRRSNIADRKTIAAAIRRAIEANFITLVQEGRFDPNGGAANQPAAYGIKWAERGAGVGSKTPPAARMRSVLKPHRLRANDSDSIARGISATSGSEIPPGAEIPLGSKSPPAPESVQEPYRRRSGNPTDNGSKTQLLERALPKEDSKEQPQQLLERVGFDRKTAKLLASRVTGDLIERQILWLDRRAPSKSRLGMLRRAIEEDWPEPETIAGVDAPALLLARGFYAAIAGNNGKAVAVPSTADQRAAEAFIERLADVVDPDQLGREFAARVRSWRGASAGAASRGGTSLVAALRSFGDRFVALRESTPARKRESAGDADRAAYYAHLAADEEKLRKSRPADLREFEAWRDRERARYQRDAKLLEWFESEAKRLDDLRTFFEQDLPTFEAWRGR